MEPVFKPKLFSVLSEGYTKDKFLQDLFSGIIVGIVALPLAIAFAVASGVSPEKGIITAIIAGFIISFFGGSRVQIGGPTGAFIIIVFGILQEFGFNGLMISTILAGIFLILFNILKLGTLLKFIPHPLIIGFTSGIALVIFSTQIKDAFGMNIEKVPTDFIAKWNAYFHSLHLINPYALGITVITICIAIFSKYITRKIPGSFIAIILVTIIVQVIHIPVETIESVFGSIPQNISFQTPTINFSELHV